MLTPQTASVMLDALTAAGHGQSALAGVTAMPTADANPVGRHITPKCRNLPSLLVTFATAHLKVNAMAVLSASGLGQSAQIGATQMQIAGAKPPRPRFLLTSMKKQTFLQAQASLL